MAGDERRLRLSHHGAYHVPKILDPPRWFDRLNTIWWFVALLRFRASPYLMVPIVVGHPFSADGSEDAQCWPMDVEKRLLPVEKDAPREVRVMDLERLKEN